MSISRATLLSSVLDWQHLCTKFYMGPLMTMRGHEHPPPVAHLADSTMLLRKIPRLQLTCSTVNTDCWSTFVLLRAFTNTLDKYPLQLASEIQEKKAQLSSAVAWRNALSKFSQGLSLLYLCKRQNIKWMIVFLPCLLMGGNTLQSFACYWIERAMQ